LWGRTRKFVRSDADAQIANCPLRFQGQYEDAESGLYYNLNRYYDPLCGMYLSPDPIGLAGGLRPHSYVHNPTSWIDPLGLASCRSKRERRREQEPEQHQPKKNAVLAERAKALGFTQRIPPHRAPFDSHGEQVFFNPKKKLYLTRDRDGHNVTDGWKVVKKINGEYTRLGTYDSNFVLIKG